MLVVTAWARLPLPPGGPGNTAPAVQLRNWKVSSHKFLSREQQTKTGKRSVQKTSFSVPSGKTRQNKKGKPFTKHRAELGAQKPSDADGPF